jgi:N-acetylglutamate synthase-like GNAT family acetyltransferase
MSQRVSPLEFFNVYTEDRRQVEISGYQIEQFPHLLCYTPKDKSREGLVTFAKLAPKRYERQIYDQIRYFELVGVAFEWKVYEFDEPADLVTRLEGHGFSPGDTEALLACSLNTVPPPLVDIASGFRVERVENLAGLADLIAIQSSVWKQDLAQLQIDLTRAFQQAPDTYSFYCAYDNQNRVIGSGYTHYPRGSRFPELRGGAVDPQWQGKGIFRAITRTRLIEARDRMFDYVTTDATHMNYEVLAKMGFEMICHNKSMRKKAPIAIPSPEHIEL